MNTNACYDLNFKLLKSFNDPGDQLKWLEQELSELEANNKSAYIMGHVPTIACLDQFGHRLDALMIRYKNTIRLSSFGHVHRESFYLTTDLHDEPVGFNFIHGSVTSYGKGNPTFYVLDWDAEDFSIVDIHCYYLDLKKDDAKWQKLYSLKAEYGLKDLSPASIKQAIDRMYKFDYEGKLYA